MQQRDDHFDRDFTLTELLTGMPHVKLKQSMEALLGVDFRLLTAKGEVLLGTAEPLPVACRCELLLDIEPLGFLEAPATMKLQAQACASLIELTMKSAARYLMASHLHENNVNENYKNLLLQHEALLKSELQYKQLSEELESRVQAQVKIIKQAERQLYQAEKMASVGQLAAGVAHEINNPIGFIRSNLGTAKAYVQNFSQLAPLIKSGVVDQLAAVWNEGDMDFVLEDFSSLLNESISGADRVARIVADLKGFSNIDHTEEEVISINDCITSVCNVAASRIPAGVHVVMQLEQTPPLRCRPGHLNQVFLNLLLNALQAVGEQGKIRIRTESITGVILVHVIDTGIGITEENMLRIFDPFFTTHDVGHGTGLGLTVCRDIVQAHGGSIVVESKKNEGSHFTVYLPLDRNT